MTASVGGGCGATLPGGGECDYQVQCSRCSAMSNWQHDGWAFRHGWSIRSPRFMISYDAMRDADHEAAIQLEANYARHGMRP